MPVARSRIVGVHKFREWLRDWARMVGPGALASELGLSPSQLSNIISGRALVGPELATRFGFTCRDVRVYTPIEAENVEQTPHT
jgi:hypothetical protein